MNNASEASCILKNSICSSNHAIAHLLANLPNFLLAALAPWTALKWLLSGSLTPLSYLKVALKARSVTHVKACHESRIDPVSSLFCIYMSGLSHSGVWWHRSATAFETGPALPNPAVPWQVLPCLILQWQDTSWLTPRVSPAGCHSCCGGAEWAVWATGVHIPPCPCEPH